MIAEQGLVPVTEGPLGMILLSKSPDRHTTAVGRFIGASPGTRTALFHIFAKDANVFAEELGSGKCRDRITCVS